MSLLAESTDYRCRRDVPVLERGIGTCTACRQPAICCDMPMMPSTTYVMLEMCKLVPNEEGTYEVKAGSFIARSRKAFKGPSGLRTRSVNSKYAHQPADLYCYCDTLW